MTTRPGDDISVEELARRSGATPGQLREWARLNLLGNGEGLFRVADVERARLARVLVEHGIDTEAISAWAATGRMNRYADLLEDERAGPVWTAEEAAAEVGLDPAFVVRMLALISDVNPTALTEGDVAVLRALRAAIDGRLPEDAVAQLVRVYGDALGRIAKTEARLFRFYIARSLATAGLSEPEFAARFDWTGRAADPLMEPLILYFHRRAFQRAIRRDAVVEVAKKFAGLGPETEHLTEIIAAVVFVDIASFTPLVEAVGDAPATEILGRFSSLVRAEVEHRDGSVVKQIGDAFMLTFDRADAAVRAAVAIQAAAVIPENGIPALHAGVHWGRLLYWEGDYVGTTVNIASRLADDADEEEVIVSSAVRNEFGSFFRSLLRAARRPRGLEVCSSRSRSTPPVWPVRRPTPDRELEDDPPVARRRARPVRRARRMVRRSVLPCGASSGGTTTGATVAAAKLDAGVQSVDGDEAETVSASSGRSQPSDAGRGALAPSSGAALTERSGAAMIVRSARPSRHLPRRRRRRSYACTRTPRLLVPASWRSRCCCPFCSSLPPGALRYALFQCLISAARVPLLLPVRLPDRPTPRSSAGRGSGCR